MTHSYLQLVFLVLTGEGSSMLSTSRTHPESGYVLAFQASQKTQQQSAL